MARSGVPVTEIAQKFGGSYSAIRVLIGRSGESCKIRENYLRIRRDNALIHREFREENSKAIKVWKAIEAAWRLSECEVCGKIFTTVTNGFICSEKCHGAKYYAKNREIVNAKAKAKARAKSKLERIQNRERRKEWFKNNPKPCKECGHPISAEKRSVCDSAVFCSPLCHSRNRAKRPEYIADKAARYLSDKLLGKHRKQKAAWYAKIPTALITKSLRNRLRRAVIGAGGSKEANTESLTGCSSIELISWLKARFQPGMTMENYGSYWHVDHAISCKSFDLTKPEEQKKCFHYTNLQPLEGSKNISKGDNCWSVIPNRQ